MGIHGYWGAYRNIFALCDQLGIHPFTDWTPSHQYSYAGLEVVAPIFRVGDCGPSYRTLKLRDLRSLQAARSVLSPSDADCMCHTLA